MKPLSLLDHPAIMESLQRRDNMAAFKRGDAVIAKDKAKHPFWMTVLSVTSTRVYTKLGASGAYLGSFAFDDVEHYIKESQK